MSRNMISAENLPVKKSLFGDFRASQFIAILIVVSALVGLLFSERIYPTEDLYRSFAPNDVINLVIGLPVLLVALRLTRKGNLVGLLIWPGALLYMVYNYLIYLVGMPISLYSIVFLILVVGSSWVFVRVARNINGEDILAIMSGNVPEKFSGGLIMFFGIFFIGRVIGLVFEAVSAGNAIPMTEIGLHVADVLLSVFMVLGGVQLWRKQELGYVLGLGMLFQMSMLFLALIAVMALHPLFLGGVMPWGDILAVFLMGFVTFIPCVMFVLGINRNQ